MNLDFEALLTSAPLQKLKRIKSEYRFCCPFHLDKTPSAFFNIDKGTFICFGCGVRCGYMKFFQHIGVYMPESFVEVKFEKEPDQYDSYEAYLGAYENSLELGAWHFNNVGPLSMFPLIENWVSSRLFNSAIDGYVIPIDCGYNEKRNSILFRTKYNIVEKLLAGRYINYGEPAHIFTDTVDATGRLFILVEGVFDWLVLRQLEECGYPFRSGSMLGTTLTDIKLGDISNLNPDEIGLAFDNDTAGRKGYDIGYPRVMQVHSKVSQIPWVEGVKDFGDMGYNEILNTINSRQLIFEQLIGATCYEY